MFYNDSCQSVISFEKIIVRSNNNVTAQVLEFDSPEVKVKCWIKKVNNVLRVLQIASSKLKLLKALLTILIIMMTNTPHPTTIIESDLTSRNYLGEPKIINKSEKLVNPELEIFKYFGIFDEDDEQINELEKNLEKRKTRYKMRKVEL